MQSAFFFYIWSLWSTDLPFIREYKEQEQNWGKDFTISWLVSENWEPSSFLHQFCLLYCLIGLVVKVSASRAEDP